MDFFCKHYNFIGPFVCSLTGLDLSIINTNRSNTSHQKVLESQMVQEANQEETSILNIPWKLKIPSDKKIFGENLYSIYRKLKPACDDADLARNKTVEVP